MVWHSLNTQYVIFVVTLFYALLHIQIESFVLITKHRKWALWNIYIHDTNQPDKSSVKGF